MISKLKDQTGKRFTFCTLIQNIGVFFQNCKVLKRRQGLLYYCYFEYFGFKPLSVYFSHTPSECLDHALNVLSRGLEKNKTSVELWENYLTLFARHPDKQELGVMCQTALQLTPSYAIWWKVCPL